MDALEELGLIDTPESESFDRITRMAAQFFTSPISAVSLTDRTRQFFKSYVGTPGREIPRIGAPCAEVTRSRAFLHVSNLLEDERFHDSPLAKAGVRFYAGAPLTTRSGFTLGAMCVLDSVPRTLTSAQIKSLEDMAAVVMAQIELQHEFGRIDPSSGLPNRHQMYEDIEDQQRNQPDRPAVLVLIQLTDFHHVSEAVSVLGASYIDEVIKAAILEIKASRGRKDGIYQVGFASLAIMLEPEKEPWLELVQDLGARLHRPLSHAGIPLNIVPVFGISPFRTSNVSPQDLLRTAVSAANDARQTELEYAVYSVASDEALQRRFHILAQVRESLKASGHFYLLYQPRLDLHTGRCSSAEALLRWDHPQLGSVSPGEFIPVIEQTALTGPLTQWVLNAALMQIKAWREQGVTLCLSVNVSARNLEEKGFAGSVAAALLHHGLHPADLELEFTEGALIRHKARVLEQLNQLCNMGVGLAIDDFGTGYSSFAYLRELPATTLKLDQCFMRELHANLRDQVLVQSLISMAHDINYRVVAEGVETAEVLELLRTCRCDEIQGYYVARPMAAAGIEDFLAGRPGNRPGACLASSAGAFSPTSEGFNP